MSRGGVRGLRAAFALSPLATAVALLFLVGAVFTAAESVPLATAVALAGVQVARFRQAAKGNVLPWRHFLVSRGLVLTLLLFGAAELGDIAVRGARSLSGGMTSSGLLDAAICGSAAFALIWLIVRIFEGKTMKSIFQLVPEGQRDTLSDFLRGVDPNAAGGQTADLSSLNPAQVIACIREKVIGQDPVVSESVTTIFRRAKLRRAGKPIAVLMFVGATGAGKTELAKALADEVFEGRLIRVDCNEMTQPQSTQRLIGPPPGYAGFEQGGQLCRDIARLGTGVLLLDEIEKAHPDVMKLVMGLFDEGRLTEQSTGKTYLATGFVIVLTSNTQAAEIARIAVAVADPQERAARVKDELQSAGGFRPEQLARIDEIFAFADLDREAVAEIVGKFLLGFAREVGVAIHSVDAGLLIDLIHKREKLKGYGVREVIRLVEKAVLDGMIDARERGFKAVSISTGGDRVIVAGVE